MALRRTSAAQWNRAKAVIKAMPQAANMAMNEAMNRLAEKGIRTVQQHIVLQDLNWVSLRKSTIDRKGNSKAWIDKGKLYENIISKVSQGEKIIAKGKFGVTTKTLSCEVGIKSGVTYDDGKEISEVAKVLEFGGKSGKAYIYARPLFSPSVKEIEAWNIAYNDPRRIVVEILRAI